jgi:hypothetical protein
MSEKNSAKYAARIRLRFEKSGLDAAVRYGLALLLGLPGHDASVLSAIPLPVAVALRSALKQRPRDKAAASAAMTQSSRTAASKALTRLDGLRGQLVSARANGAAARFLAGLKPIDRDAIGLPAERRLAIALRSTGISSTAARKLLACSMAELDRWHGDGRLPHLYKREMSLSRMVEARFWDPAAVESARDQVENWRAQDRVRAVHKRKGLKPVRGGAR